MKLNNKVVLTIVLLVVVGLLVLSERNKKPVVKAEKPKIAVVAIKPAVKPAPAIVKVEAPKVEVKKVDVKK